MEQARRDIGIRIALGATRDRVLAMVMNRVAWMLGAGSAVGIVLTLTATKIDRHWWFISTRRKRLGASC